MRTSDFADLDIDRVVDDRIDPHACEGGVAARVAVIGRDAHQAMHAGFGLQPAIGVVALDQHGRRLDARLFAVVDFQHLDLEASAFGPARVHAKQHRGPVLAFGAACAGVDFEIGIVAVGFARKHRLDLARLHLARHRADRRLGFVDNRLVAFLLAELDQADIVLERLGDAADTLDAVFQRLALPHQFLGFLRVVPEGGVLGAHVQVIKPLQRLIPVKDASSAGLCPA